MTTTQKDLHQERAEQTLLRALDDVRAGKKLVSIQFRTDFPDGEPRYVTTQEYK